MLIKYNINIKCVYINIKFDIILNVLNCIYQYIHKMCFFNVFNSFDIKPSCKFCSEHVKLK